MSLNLSEYTSCLDIASFPGPTQLSIILQVTESWAWSGNEASIDMCVVYQLRIHVMFALLF